MMDLVTHHLLFTTQVQTPLELDEHSGSALRGNLFESVWQRFCDNRSAPSCADCPLHSRCPVSALVAPLREEHHRGRDIPRPYVLRPPLDRARCYAPGNTLTFGVTLFGSIIELLPYLLLSTKTMEAVGLGKKISGRRGTFRIKQIESYHPFSGERQVIYKEGKPLVNASTLSVTSADVQVRAAALSSEQLNVTFLTPMRVMDKQDRVTRLTFRPFFQRLMERLIGLEEAYGSGDKAWSEARTSWLEQAETIRTLENTTSWEEVQSFSRRTHRHSPTGGLLGTITFGGELTAFRELLVWGELVHAGKSCVKGNGWYKVRSA